MTAELKKRREERVARNVKIIIRGYTSSAYVSAAGFSSNVEGRFYNSWPTTSTFTCSLAVIFANTQAGYCRERSREHTRGIYRLLLVIWNGCILLRSFRATYESNARGKRNMEERERDGRAEIDLLGSNGLNFGGKIFRETVEEIILRRRVDDDYFVLAFE